MIERSSRNEFGMLYYLRNETTGTLMEKKACNLRISEIGKQLPQTLYMGLFIFFSFFFTFWQVLCRWLFFYFRRDRKRSLSRSGEKERPFFELYESLGCLLANVEGFYDIWIPGCFLLTSTSFPFALCLYLLFSCCSLFLYPFVYRLHSTGSFKLQVVYTQYRLNISIS